MKIQTILYTIYILFLLTTLAGCSNTEIPIEEDDLVAIELVGLNGSVQVSRAGIDPSLTAIHNATIIVFDGTEDKVLHRRTINYTDGERVYLKRGGTYKVFVIANLDDDNCPNGDAATYFDDVTNIAHLDNKYFISSAEPGEAPAKMPMISGTTSDPLHSVTIPPAPLAVADTKVTLELRSLYTKVSVNIYNKVNGGGSGVELLSYYASNLPVYSWIVEQASDYPQTLDPKTTGYDRSSLMDIRQPTQTTEDYACHSFDVYCLENRRGSVAGLTNPYYRKAQAPEYAFEINFQGNISNNKVLQTYLLVGKDNDNSNFDVDRNCIYTVNVYVNSTTNISSDSRRMSLDVVVCGELESPEDGEGKEF
ncbi:hypothetical protein LJC38_02450 [Parabacteroides sp. OttesenSCG-928-K15]|nr:hypothetical protein [Parabacteroides sp. OttesenSCG-928-K15]